jgi:D-sedoheptulose 7-phosphate isomerase
MTDAASVDHVRRRFHETADAQLRTLEQCVPGIARSAALIAEAFHSGHKLLLCGNGGSAADCQHMATEFVSRLRRGVERRALPALALTTDTSFLTAYANDSGFEGIFARQVEAFGEPGDILLGISTSGSSANVGRALAEARARQMVTIGLFGETATLAADVDVAILIPSRDTQVIQECMLPVEHIICELVEETLFGATQPHSDGGA